MHLGQACRPDNNGGGGGEQSPDSDTGVGRGVVSQGSVFRTPSKVSGVADAQTGHTHATLKNSDVAFVRVLNITTSQRARWRT